MASGLRRCCASRGPAPAVLYKGTFARVAAQAGRWRAAGDAARPRSATKRPLWFEAMLRVPAIRAPAVLYKGAFAHVAAQAGRWRAAGDGARRAYVQLVLLPSTPAVSLAAVLALALQPPVLAVSHQCGRVDALGPAPAAPQPMPRIGGCLVLRSRAAVLRAQLANFLHIPPWTSQYECVGVLKRGTGQSCPPPPVSTLLTVRATATHR
jgi:hypothetical protein